MVDFITIAAESRRMLRVLDEMLGGDDDEDDFGAGGQQQNVQQFDSALAAATAASSSATSATATRPLLSKTAEGELYLLATNFLLYVAMVIITTIVAKVYFPESRKKTFIYSIASSAGPACFFACLPQSNFDGFFLMLLILVRLSSSCSLCLSLSLSPSLCGRNYCDYSRTCLDDSACKKLRLSHGQ